jgi:hypothetical protein
MCSRPAQLSRREPELVSEQERAQESELALVLE